MRNWADELKKRSDFVREHMEAAHASGFIYGNSGGKDCSLVSIICRNACENTLGLIMPCMSAVNLGSDYDDAMRVAEKFGIPQRVIDLSETKKALLAALPPMEGLALANINPRLRMTTLYAIGQAENRLVVGTGNRCERYLGYFTKWGDGACDINPIADLTVSEVYDFLRYLGCPEEVINKAPSAGLYEGQTDESELGLPYSAVDELLLTGKAPEEYAAAIERHHMRSEHKRQPVPLYASDTAEGK